MDSMPLSSLVAPWGVIVGVLAVLLALVTFIIDMEDRQSERLFSAWRFIIEHDQLMRKYEDSNNSTAPLIDASLPNSENSNSAKISSHVGGAVFQAAELINREVKGQLCASWLQHVFQWLTGSVHRQCIIPYRPRGSLENRYLPYSELAGIDLGSAVLERTNLESSNLICANLRDANLRKANLSHTDLSGAKLTRASLSDSCMRRADLFGADLTKAKLNEANLTNSNLRQADFSSARLLHVLLMEANLSGANLNKAKLRGADLTDADLSSVNLDGAKFSNTNVSNAKLYTAKHLSKKQVAGMCISKGSVPPAHPDYPGVKWNTKICKSSNRSATEACS